MFTEANESKLYEIEMVIDGKEYDVLFAADGKVLKTTFEGVKIKDGVLALAEAEFFIEYNHTDGDAGVQIFLDGDAWESMEIHDPNGNEIYGFSVANQARKIGITELFF